MQNKPSIQSMSVVHSLVYSSVIGEEISDKQSFPSLHSDPYGNNVASRHVLSRYSRHDPDAQS